MSSCVHVSSLLPALCKSCSPVPGALRRTRTSSVYTHWHPTWLMNLTSPTFGMRLFAILGSWTVLDKIFRWFSLALDLLREKLFTWNLFWWRTSCINSCWLWSRKVYFIQAFVYFLKTFAKRCINEYICFVLEENLALCSRSCVLPLKSE